MSNMESDIIPKPLPRTPVLVPVFIMNLQLDEPDSIFSNKPSNKSLSLSKIIHGEVTTLKNKLDLTLEVRLVMGFDDLTSNLDTGEGTLDCKLYGKTPNGSGVYITYGGIVRLSDNSLKVVSNQSMELTFEDSYITCNPKFQFDDCVEEQYRWAEQENLIGKGRFTRNPQGSLYVQFIIYILQ